MDIQTSVQQYLKTKPATLVDFPFDNVTEVYKVKGKMFALLGSGKDHLKAPDNSTPYFLNLKCDPDEALMLRDIFPAIIAGYHMNKKHWNTVILDGSIPQGEIERMIDNSFDLVVSKMTKKDQASILLHL
ncbi:MmcQ/YjbR family DNA-binding protein [Psychrosphaera sp. F3M07]|uniref:MmcQ/YjbR family DNA-binding protein n=1 Tax=Psychrosphaera sp. F3M07 TaxID=2841560 RepID=UPI001C087FD4|nr:MmcQ/YjbR family DNA-binding protein [Psychrosphaera sp. F3M07]MBU2918140.1 MmcQ/YjbR family DNA-binding protein [Psychrosphaera sp. F3M07]